MEELSGKIMKYTLPYYVGFEVPSPESRGKASNRIT